MRIAKNLICLMLVLALSLSFFACGGSSKVTLNVLNWGDYIDPALLQQFEKETGISVKYTTMTSNEEMLVKLSSPDCIYDVCFPSDYIIEKLIADDLLYAINKENIPNIENIDPRFLDLSFDPDNTYSVPYMWGTVGILYNTTMVSSPIDSWSALWDEQYSGEILMYDSMRDTIGITLKMLGKDINTREAADVLAAQEALIAQKPLVRAYLTDDIKMELINGSAAMGVVYSGDAVYCIGENPDLAYVVPKEGSNVWFDNVIIPKTATHKTEAEQFINFLCDANIAAQNSDYIGYSTPNAAALQIMGADYIDDVTFNPPQDVLDRCQIYHDLGDFVTVFSDAWTKVKAA
ncbi:MAG TPA: spermidine/putrescine ABC transporter substrate-binding protein [Candidatus Cryosericum sp.]|nr:spermidine/putrescine ABC transporter substrate-binding protein [Candidatus Cryosericum sp.]